MLSPPLRTNRLQDALKERFWVVRFGARAGLRSDIAPNAEPDAPRLV